MASGRGQQERRPDKNSRREITQDGKRWRPRRFSYFTDAFFFVAVIAFALFAFTRILVPDNDTGTALGKMIDPFYQYSSVYLPVGLAAAVAAAVAEYVSRTKIPPAAWRVRQELTRCLCDLGILKANDTSYWRGADAYWVSPIGKFNKAARCFELQFDVRSVKADEDTFNKVENAISGFAHSQDVSIEPNWDRNHRQKGWRLLLWYTEDPFETSLQRIDPLA